MEIKTPPKTHAYAYHIFRAWYNGSYAMAIKPIKFLELHYTMTQFLINQFLINLFIKNMQFKEFDWLSGHRV